MENTEFTIVDIETTGLSYSYHKITEIAAIKVKNGQVIETFEELVNPQVPIPSFIKKLTGISDDMVKDKPTINEVIPKFKDFLGNSIIVAHNSTFDYNFLSHNSFLVTGQHLCNRHLCTKRLAGKLLPELPNKKLKTVCEHFQIQNLNAHRAMSDTHATMIVFSNFVSIAKENGLNNVEDLIGLQNTRR